MLAQVLAVESELENLTKFDETQWERVPFKVRAYALGDKQL
jgi:hypothetical protein